MPTSNLTSTPDSNPVSNASSAAFEPSLRVVQGGPITAANSPKRAPSDAPTAASAAGANAASSVGAESVQQLRLRDLTVRPTPMFFLLLMPVPPLLVAAIGYGSIAAAVVAMLLLTTALSCLWICMSTLRGLRLRYSPMSPCFAGDTAMMEVRIDNPGGRDRWDIGLGIDRPAYPGPSTWVDVPPRSYNLALLALPTTERGLLRLPALRIDTEHPFGVVRAWARWEAGDVLQVFPRPELDGPSLPRARDASGALRLDPTRAGLDEDVPPGVIGGDEAREAVERAASRLTAWVLRAERLEMAYGLRLGVLVVPAGRGLRHQRRCLELLAQWDGKPPRSWAQLCRSHEPTLPDDR